jgi:LPS-assembly lipoprotein
MLKTLLSTVAVLSVLQALTGCSSYRPLYGAGAGEHAVAAALAGISVREQKTRAGQLVRNELLSIMRGTGGANFQLDMRPEEKTRKISDISGQKLERFRYHLKVDYVLLDASGNKVVTEGKAFSTVSYDTVEQPVSDLQAAENARMRATREVAEDIRLRLAAFLASN